MNAKTTGGLLLAGLAAWAVYKYRNMSPEAKQKMVSSIKETGKKWVAPLNNRFTRSAGEQARNLV